jgi:hypothetical protein
MLSLSISASPIPVIFYNIVAPIIFVANNNPVADQSKTYVYGV